MTTNIQDLNLEKEILPLFDFSNNDFTKNVIVAFLGENLETQGEVNARQEILKAFISNGNVLKEYSNSRFDFLEAYRFLNELSVFDVKGFELKIQLLFSEKTDTKNEQNFLS